MITDARCRHVAGRAGHQDRVAGAVQGAVRGVPGSNSVVPDAIGVWAEGTKKLLDSEEVRRATRRGGSG